MGKKIQGMSLMRMAALLAAIAAIPAISANAGPYSSGMANANPNAPDPAIAGLVGSEVNPIFCGWATGVAGYQPTPGVSSEWKQPGKALGTVTGDNFDVATLGDLYDPGNPPAVGAKPPFSNDGRPFSGDVHDPNDGWGFIGIDPPGQITLSFADGIGNGPGADFAVFENSIAYDSVQVYGELGYVEVSADGVVFARFPSVSLTAGAVGPYGALDPTNVYNLAGKHVNASGNSWGTPFDLDDLLADPLVIGGQVNLDMIHYVRIVDVVGKGDSLDSLGHPIYDAWPTYGSGGMDLEAVGVINKIEPQFFNLEVRAAADTVCAPMFIAGAPAGTTNYNLAVGAGEAVSLTAPAPVGGGEAGHFKFVRWTINGVPAPDGQATVGFDIVEGTVAAAEYLHIAGGDCDHSRTNPVDFWDFMGFLDCYSSFAGDGRYDVCGDLQADSPAAPPDGDVDFWDFMAFIDVYNQNVY